MKIGIIGTGVFSASIANMLAQNTENKIIMWSENKKLVTDYKKTNKLESICKDKVFPSNITLTPNYDTALKDVDVVFLMTSIQFVESVCTSIKDKIDKNVLVCIGTKGISMMGEKRKFAYQIAKSILRNPLAVLSGPTFAEDVLSLDPVAFSIACRGKKNKSTLLKTFENPNVKVVFTSDYIGVSLASSVKNIYAIGAGILAGLGYKESTLAYYLTSVYKELETILYMYESSLTTLHSLAGFGDLVATCSSSKSRNYHLGLLLGKKKSKKEMDTFKENNTIEGLSSLEHCLYLFNKKHIKTPIMSSISKIVNEDEHPATLLNTIKEVKLNSIY